MLLIKLLKNKVKKTIVLFFFLLMFGFVLGISHTVAVQSHQERVLCASLWQC